MAFATERQMQELLKNTELPRVHRVDEDLSRTPGGRDVIEQICLLPPQVANVMQVVERHLCDGYLAGAVTASRLGVQGILKDRLSQRCRFGHVTELFLPRSLPDSQIAKMLHES